MAIFQVPEAFLYAQNAGADLSSGLHKLAHIDTDGDIVLAGNGEPVAGVIIEGGEQNTPVTIQFGGIAKVLTGAAVTAGAQVASDASGLAVTATSDEHVFGIALASADSGDIIPVMIARGLGV